MTKAGNRILKSAQQALAYAKGEADATVYGVRYRRYSRCASYLAQGPHVAKGVCTAFWRQRAHGTGLGTGPGQPQARPERSSS